MVKDIDVAKPEELVELLQALQKDLVFLRDKFKMLTLWCGYLTGFMVVWGFFIFATIWYVTA